MSGRYGYGGSYPPSSYYDSSDDELSPVKSNAATSSSGRPRAINDMLKAALEKAAEEGEGDEEPEVLPPPPDSVRGRSSADDMDEDSDGEATYQSKKGTARTESIDKAKAHAARIAMEEEEKRVAALTFDENALLPFDDMKERSKYIPLRLSYEERKSLRTVNAAINVSDYTNMVDIAFKSKARRTNVRLQKIVALLSGLVASTSYDEAQRILDDRNFEEHEDMIAKKLEIARSN